MACPLCQPQPSHTDNSVRRRALPVARPHARGRIVVHARAVDEAGVLQNPARTTPVATYTHHGTNSFTLEFNGGGKLLVDPWLVGTLSFGEQTWLLESSKWLPPNVDEILDGVDAILLSQSLDDHTHVPTLKVLPKNIPIIAQPEAAVTALDLGFSSVRSLDHGQQVSLAQDRVSVKALPGALVGPPWSKRQNSFLISGRSAKGDDAAIVTVYAEAHASYDVQALRSIAPVDVAIIPAASSYVAGYPVVTAIENGKKLIEAVQPTVVVPLNNSDGEYEGAVAGAIKSVGSNDKASVKEWIDKLGFSGIQVVAPAMHGEAVTISI